LPQACPQHKEVPIEAEEELFLLVKFDEFSKPGICPLPGYSFASDREGCHETQCILSEGVVAVFGIEHGDNGTFSDSETGVAGHVAELVGIVGGVVSGVINLELSGA
jgi:hypothetical protein